MMKDVSQSYMRKKTKKQTLHFKKPPCFMENKKVEYKLTLKISVVKWTV